MRKMKNVLAVAMAAAVAVGALAPIYAEVKEYETYTTNTPKAECVVTYTQDSTFSVTIPKTVELDSSKTQDYNVTVVGDIASNEKITVVPDASFLMEDQSGASVLKDDVTATVTQAKQEFVYSEISGEGMTTGGNIDAKDLTAGSWKGKFNFAISLE